VLGGNSLCICRRELAARSAAASFLNDVRGCIVVLTRQKRSPARTRRAAQRDALLIKIRGPQSLPGVNLTPHDARPVLRCFTRCSRSKEPPPLCVNYLRRTVIAAAFFIPRSAAPHPLRNDSFRSHALPTRRRATAPLISTFNVQPPPLVISLGSPRVSAPLRIFIFKISEYRACIHHDAEAAWSAAADF
jgi:hypothetical protein